MWGIPSVWFYSFLFTFWPTYAMFLVNPGDIKFNPIWMISFTILGIGHFQTMTPWSIRVQVSSSFTIVFNVFLFPNENVFRHFPLLRLLGVFAAGAAIRVAIKPMYQVAPPVCISRSLSLLFGLTEGWTLSHKYFVTFCMEISTHAYCLVSWIGLERHGITLVCNLWYDNWCFSSLN